jgi:hypothetical protein
MVSSFVLKTASLHLLIVQSRMALLGWQLPESRGDCMCGRAVARRAARSAPDEVNDNRARFPLLIADFDTLSVSLPQLLKQGQWIVVVDETHRFAGL